MNFNRADIATQIVTLPQTFHSLGNVSIFTLLKATGYFELHDEISEGVTEGVKIGVIKIGVSPHY